MNGDPQQPRRLLEGPWTIVPKCVLFLALLAPLPALAQPDAPSITVVGQASAALVPDTALITLGIVTERPHAADAAAENGRAVQGVIDAVHAEGVEAHDIRTVSVSLSPVFDQPAQGAPKVTGFRASNELQIRVKPVDRAAVLSGKLIDKGVNSISDVQFTSDQDEKLSDKLRGDAVGDARRKAEVLVRALGIRLGRVLRVDPEPQGSPGDGFAVRGAAQFRHVATPVPLQAGQGSAEERVSVTWELLQ